MIVPISTFYSNNVLHLLIVTIADHDEKGGVSRIFVEYTTCNIKQKVLNKYIYRDQYKCIHFVLEYISETNQ